MLPWPPKALSPNARVHHMARSRAAKKYRMQCYLLAMAAGLRGVEWDGSIHVWITFLAPDRRRRDHDNMIASSKNLLDGLADALGVNDRLFHIHPLVSDEVVKGGAVRIVLTAGVDGRLT